MLSFEKLCEELLAEMPVTSKMSAADLGKRVQERIPPGLTSGHFSPLQKLTDPAVRNAVIDAIIKATFQERDNTYSPTAHSKDDFKSAIKQAMLSVSGTNGFKVNNTSAGFLADRLWTHLQDVLEITPGESVSKEEVKQEVSQAVATVAKEENNVEPSESPKEDKGMDKEPETTSGEAKKSDMSEVFNREFSVLEIYYDEVVEKIEALNKKLSGKGIPTVTIEKTGVKTVKAPERDELFKEITFKVNVPALQLPGGWKFVARVDHEAIGNLIVSAPNTGHDKDLHKLYGNSQPSFCDHCQTTRKRTSTFVIEDEKGNLKRIGRQCLRDYLPGGEKAVSSILNYAEYITKIAEGLIELEEKEKDPDYESMGGSSRYSNFGIKGVLGMALAFIRTQGYTSKSKAQTINYQGNSFVEPTSDKVMRALTGELEKAIRQFGQGKAATELGSDVKAWEKYKDNPEKFQEEADKIIEWGKDYVAKQLEKPSNMTEYYRNLQTILNGATESGSIPKKYVGYLISIIPAYEKAKNGDGDEQSKDGKTKEEKNSEYVGTVGMPIGELSAADKRKYKGTDLSGFPFNGPINVTVTGSRQFERQGFGYYDQGGTTTMVNMVDDKGNVYVYFDNHTDEYEKGQKLVIKRALVKNHKDYTNKNTGKVVKQTILNRVTMEQGVSESVEKEEEFVSFAEHFATNPT